MHLLRPTLREKRYEPWCSIGLGAVPRLDIAPVHVLVGLEPPFDLPFDDDLNMIDIGSSDRLCWLAESCKILLLFLLVL